MDFLHTMAFHPLKEDQDLVERIKKIVKKKEWSISRVMRKLCYLGIKEFERREKNGD